MNFENSFSRLTRTKYSAFRYDEQGDRWWLQTCGTNISPPLQVDGSNQSTFMIGEPYRCVIEVANAVRNKTSNNLHELLLDMKVMGLNNDLVTDIRHIKGNNTQIQLSNTLKIHPKEPAYKIVKSDGEIVAQGPFEYG